MVRDPNYKQNVPLRTSSHPRANFRKGKILHLNEYPQTPSTQNEATENGKAKLLNDHLGTIQKFFNEKFRGF
jgi:hypothetical protein